MSMPRDEALSLEGIESERARKGQPWHEFLRVESLSMGVYALAKGALDQQTPHQQDEVYYVTKGRAVLEVEGMAHPVKAGSILFVPAHSQHRFRDITEDLSTLVFFAPAETE
jgi:quercetin dioxygenase-like cupin family protein